MAELAGKPARCEERLALPPEPSHADQAVARVPPFDAVELELGLFWA